MNNFTDVFHVNKSSLDAHGAFDISLISDLPLFVDPFLLFSSDKPEYQQLHQDIIHYLEFLRDKSVVGSITKAGIEQWYTFHEVKQNWLGYTVLGNGGSALGKAFAHSLNSSLHSLFRTIGEESITASTHLEKLCLIREGVGRDNISDFTVNLIKPFLLEYTEQFAVQHIDLSLRKKVRVGRAYFDYTHERWMPKEYDLPFVNGDFVLLTPKDLLTRDDAWINRSDMIEDFYLLPPAISDASLRESIEQFFRKNLPKNPTRPQERAVAISTIREFPILIDYYIRLKELNHDDARTLSDELVETTEQWFVDNVRKAVTQLEADEFYKKPFSTYEEAIARAEYFKDCIENRDVYRAFYHKGRPIAREEHAQLMFVLVWYAAHVDMNREVNNGRGPVDFKVSLGSIDKSLIEFKLAANKKLEHGLTKQIPIYEAANDTQASVKVIICFNEAEQTKVTRLLAKLELTERRDIVVIDARKDNKPSASTA